MKNRNEEQHFHTGGGGYMEEPVDAGAITMFKRQVNEEYSYMG